MVVAMHSSFNLRHLLQETVLLDMKGNFEYVVLAAAGVTLSRVLAFMLWHGGKLLRKACNLHSTGAFVGYLLCL